MRILLADDDHTLCSAIQEELHTLGYEVVLAHDGQKALEILTSPQPPQIAILDWHMPKKSGLEVCQEIKWDKKTAQEIYIILITGQEPKKNIAVAIGTGADDFLHKPFEFSELTCRIMAGERLIRARTELHQHRKFYTSLFQKHPDILLLFDPDTGTILDANQAATLFYGYTLAEMQDLGLEDIIDYPPEKIKRRLDKILARDNTILLSRHKLKTGKKVEVEVQTSKITINERLIVLVTVHDLRKTTEAEQRLKKAHLELGQIISAISSILITLNQELEVLRWNEAAEQVFSLKAEEAKGKKITQLPLSWDKELLDQALGQSRDYRKRIHTDNIQYSKPDGSNGFLGLTIHPMLGTSSNEAQGFVILATDITRKKVFESQMVHSQKLEAIGQLAAGIAHEINTPVQYIQGNITYLQDTWNDILELLKKYSALILGLQQGKSDPQLLEEISALQEALDLEFLAEDIPQALKESLEGVERVTKIVKSMKDFSHPGEQEKAPTDLNKALESTITISRNEWKYHCDLTADFAPDLPLVPCFRDEINQVFLNIIVNAAQAIKEKIEERGEEGEKGQIHISTKATNHYAEIRIKDTGKGIPPEIQDRIFDPFFTTKGVGKGTGQGLYLAYDIVTNKHQGQLSFESIPGEGTTFIIQLPLHQTGQQAG